jgi:hypothetical protein
MNQNLLYGIVLLSAVGHAVWNALLKNATDRLIMMIAIRIVGLLYGLIVLSVVEWPATASLPWLLAAALAMWIYQGLLIKGYQVGDLSFVYPLARGIAPVLLTGLAFLSIGEKITSQQLLGVISISFGIATLAFLGQGGRSSLVYAALTGASIATYSLLSGVGVRSSGNLLGFSAALEAATGLGMLIYATSTRGRSIVPSLAPRHRHAGNRRRDANFDRPSHRELESLRDRGAQSRPRARSRQVARRDVDAYRRDP